MLTQELIRSLLDYNPETGIFTWKRRTVEQCASKRAASVFNSSFAGKAAGTESSHLDSKYLVISVLNKRYYAHRLAWLYMYGYMPDMVIDHINGNSLDNRICNIRSTSISQNQKNKSLQHNNKTGLSGVWWCVNREKYLVYITSGNKRKYLGITNDLFEAACIRKRHELIEHFHKNHNRPSVRKPKVRLSLFN